jgi:hypothetical protein
MHFLFFSFEMNETSQKDFMISRLVFSANIVDSLRTRITYSFEIISVNFGSFIVG